MRQEDEILEQLARDRQEPPPDFVARVMKALPDRPDLTWRERFAAVWPQEGRWLVPAAAGALAALLLFAGLSLTRTRAPSAATITVTFELHAPEVEQVELAGSFNDWRTGEIVLTREDESSPWSITMTLPQGRHEYLFFVDGRRWITDPKALTCRPDGFGNCNAVLEI